MGTSPPHHSPCWDWGHWCRSPFWDKALGQRARAGQLLLGGAGAAVPPQTLAPSSTWSTATPRRVSPRSPGPRLSHRQEGPPSPGPPLAGSTVPSCSPDPFPEPTGPKAEVAGLPPRARSCGDSSAPSCGHASHRATPNHCEEPLKTSRQPCPADPKVRLRRGQRGQNQPVLPQIVRRRGGSSTCGSGTRWARHLQPLGFEAGFGCRREGLSHGSAGTLQVGRAGLTGAG